MEPSEVPIGRPVRVQLSRQAFADLPQISDQTGTRFVTQRNATAMRIRVPISIGSPFGQEIDIPTDGILVCELRETSAIKSALAVGAGVAVVVSALVAGGSGQPITPGNEEEGQNEGGEDPFRGGARRSIGFSIPFFF
jgi:hypothetical protein